MFYLLKIPAARSDHSDINCVHLPVSYICFMRVLILLYALYLSLSSCSRPQAAEYRGVEHFRFMGMQGNTAQVKMDLKMYNPNAFAVSVSELEATCRMDGHEAGNARLDTAVMLGARSEVLIPVTAQLEIRDLLSKGLSLLLGNGIPYEVQGTAKAGRGKLSWKIPFAHQGTLDKKILRSLLN